MVNEDGEEGGSGSGVSTKKRAAALRDDLLFRQPKISYFGDCPICFLPLSLDASERLIMTCCSKVICDGCSYANMMRELSESLRGLNTSLKRTCSFCRHPLPTTKAKAYTNIMKRVEANDPVALQVMGLKCIVKGDYRSAFEYLTKAAGLGDAVAHFHLSVMYWEGTGVEKDEKKEVYHLEEAAIAGHPLARYNLGAFEWNNGSKERAMKHFIIAANQGDDKSVGELKQGNEEGLVSKDDFAAALRAHKAAVDAMKSPQRQTAAEQAEL
eukprot:scaffold9471_cov81-Skeletonema_dohrnii-CCMP3373.AAC.3